MHWAHFQKRPAKPRAQRLTILLEKMKKATAILAAIAMALSASAAEKQFDLDGKLKLAKRGDAAAQNEIGEYYADGGGGKVEVFFHVFR